MDKDEEDILKVLGQLSKLGPIEATAIGSNVVGKILQEKLGIEHRTTSRNTLFNYTVTATTAQMNSGSRTNLFACVPDWGLSVIKSSKGLAERFGREDIPRGYDRSLFCTTTSLGANGFGLILKVSPENRTLEEWELSDGEMNPMVAWDVSKLERKLADLGKTAIVTALPIEINGERAFHYRYVDLLGFPDVGSFLELLQNGAITIDHCISIKTGTSVAREQGPLFKIRADSREELYRNVKRIDLMNL